VRSVGPEPLTWPVALVWRAARRQPPAAKAFLQLALAQGARDERPAAAAAA
jgi:DNA-binding transcriptional LysR family regulator